MDVYLFLAAFLILLLILIIVISFIVRPRAKPLTNDQIQEYLNSIERRGGFSKPVAFGPRGYCSVYTFSGPITLNTAYIDSLTPTPVDEVVSCLDDDQAYLRKVKSTCQRKPYCINLEGEEIKPGEDTIFYEQCQSGLIPCYEYNESFLGYVSLNYNSVTETPGLCLTVSSILLFSPCQPLSSRQLLRISRAMPVTLTGNIKGPLVSLFDRRTRLCILPSRIPPSRGTPLIETGCILNGGYAYWLIPPLQFTIVNENGDIDVVTSPQQLVYTSQTSFFPDNLVEYFTINEALSIQIEDNRPVLLPYVKDSNTPSGKLANTELLSYTSYK